MAVLVWDQVGERFFETGVSKGVMYGRDGLGIAWNGLTSVDEDTSKTVEPVYYDGIKFNEIITIGNFSAVIRAFTYPEELLEYEGLLQDQTGFYVSDQPQSTFSLSYQTIVGSDVDAEIGYKIHLLYNLTIVPAQRSYVSLSETVEPVEFEWTVTGIPEEIEKFRPSGHVIFDSRKIDPYLMTDLEEVLYGSETEDARLPSLKGLAAFMRKWDRLIITDFGDGTWEAYSPLDGVIVMTDETTFQITSDTATYLNPTTYEITSSEKNEEDIWLP